MRPTTQCEYWELKLVPFVRGPQAKTRRLTGKVFIDATHEGDLAAEAGASYRVGREASDEFGEPHGIERADKRVQAYCYRLGVSEMTVSRCPNTVTAFQARRRC